MNSPVLSSYLEPQQLAVSVGGAAKLVNSVRMLSEANPGFVVVKCDIKNTFNCVSRARILTVLDEEDSLKHLVWYAALSFKCLGKGF